MSFDQKPEQTTDQLTFSVGDRQYDAEAAVTKIQNADQHISTIEAENQQYKERLAALEAQVSQSTKIDEALAKLQTQQGTQDSQSTEVTPSISEEQIGAIATQRMEEYLAAKRAEEAQRNAQTVSETTFKETGAALEAIYGDRTDEAMASKAKELGITTEAIFDMAKSPTTAKLLLESMKVPTSANQSAPSGSYNTHNLVHQAPEKLVDTSKGISSSTIVEALKKAGGTY